MKLSKIFIAAVAALLSVGCYNDFDMPKSTTRTAEEMEKFMEAQGLTHISIRDMKDMFGTIQQTGTTSALSSTVHKQFVSPGTATGNDYIVGDYYIKGKVLTNDEQGNVYKSLFIWDGTGAIELKLTNGLFLEYPCDLESRKTVMVYVKLTGLYIGCYRMMLSIGDIPTEGLNAWGDYKYYANSNIVSPTKVHNHVFLGEETTLNIGTDPDDPNTDILVLNSSTYNKIRPSGSYSTTNLLSSEGPAKYLGRLIRFEGLEVQYKGVEDQNHVTPAPMKNGSYDQIYPAWICTSGLRVNGALEQVVNQPWYKWAFSENNVSLYGQLCVAFPGADTSYTSNSGAYIVRTSGYSRFANYNLPKNGAKGNVMGIYSIYTGSRGYSNFAGGSSDQATYQITVSRFEDLEFAASDCLTDEQVNALTPLESHELPKQLYEDDGMSE